MSTSFDPDRIGTIARLIAPDAWNDAQYELLPTKAEQIRDQELAKSRALAIIIQLQGDQRTAGCPVCGREPDDYVSAIMNEHASNGMVNWRAIVAAYFEAVVSQPSPA